MTAGRKPREFSSRQLAWLRSRWGHEPKIELAQVLGISKASLRRLGIKLGLGNKPKLALASIAAFYSSSGLTLLEVAQHFGCVKSTVHRACRRHGVEMRGRGRPREEDGDIDSQ